MGQAILQTERLSRWFGGLQAVRDVTLRVEQGSCHALIGPNGAGKTTLFNLLSGALRPSSGSIIFKGQPIAGLPAYRMARLGIGRVYQVASLFPNLSVLENVRLAAQARSRQTLRFWRTSASLRRSMQQAEATLAEVGLQQLAELPASALSHGDKRRLELALVLASDPQLLLLDEPTAGMASGQVPELLRLIEHLRGAGQRTILLVEHRIEVVMALADRVSVMHGGAMLAEGSPREIAADERVQQAYLGGIV